MPRRCPPSCSWLTIVQTLKLSVPLSETKDQLIQRVQDAWTTATPVVPPPQPAMAVAMAPPPASVPTAYVGGPSPQWGPSIAWNEVMQHHRDVFLAQYGDTATIMGEVIHTFFKAYESSTLTPNMFSDDARVRVAIGSNELQYHGSMMASAQLNMLMSQNGFRYSLEQLRVATSPQAIMAAAQGFCVR